MCDHGNTVPMPINGRVRDIDKCLAHVIAALNAANVRTVECCCGHGHRPGYILLEDGRCLAVSPTLDDHKELTTGFPDIHGEG